MDIDSSLYHWTSGAVDVGVRTGSSSSPHGRHCWVGNLIRGALRRPSGWHDLCGGQPQACVGRNHDHSHRFQEHIRLCSQLRGDPMDRERWLFKGQIFLPLHDYQTKLTAQWLGRRLDGLDRRSHLCDNNPHVHLWRKDSTMVRQIDHLRKILSV